MKEGLVMESPMIFFCLLSIIVFAGCTTILSSLDSGSVEQVEGNYSARFEQSGKWYDWNEHNQGPQVYYFTMTQPRFVRYLYAEIPHDPIRNVSVYSRRDDKRNWELIREIKSPLTSNTRIDINRRSVEIMLVQKTTSKARDYLSRSLWGTPQAKKEKKEIITGFKVFAQTL